MFGKATRGKSDHTKIRDKKYWMPSLLGPWKAHINYNWMNLWKLILWTAPIVIIFEKWSLPISVFRSKCTENVLLKKIYIHCPPENIQYLVQCPRDTFLVYIYSPKTTVQNLISCVLLLERLQMGQVLMDLLCPSKESASLLGYKKPRPEALRREKWEGVGKKG